MSLCFSAIVVLLRPIMERKTNNQLLVPMDFSDINEVALSHAVKVAQTYKNEILLLHVMESSLLKNLFGGMEEELVKEALMNRLTKKADALKASAGINVHVRLVEGKPYKKIAKIATEEEFDAVIMGSNGAEGVGQIIGSNASRTIQHSSVPVVVIKKSNIGPKGYQKIVMPIDLTVETRQKAEWAIHLATKFDSEIILLFENSTDDYVKRGIKANLREVTSKLDQSNVKYTLMEIEDSMATNFATETLATANKLGADLILVMTHTDKSIGEFVIGTMTQQLVNKSRNIPIMCIHPKETGFIFSYS